MEYNFEIRHGKLYRQGEIFIKFYGKVEDVLIFDNRIVILLDPDSVNNDRNVVCYDFNKELVWQLDAPPNVHGRNYYNSIYMRGDSFCAYSQSGFEAIVDITTGKIISQEFIR